MDGFSVTSAALVAAAQVATEVALDLRSAGVGAPLADLGAVLPGSATSTAADELVRRWATASRALAAALDRHGTHLTDTTAHYAGTDTSVADRLGATG